MPVRLRVARGHNAKPVTRRRAQPTPSAPALPCLKTLYRLDQFTIVGARVPPEPTYWLGRWFVDGCATVFRLRRGGGADDDTISSVIAG